MASALPKIWQDIKESVLTCEICKEPFNQQDRLPQVLPCHHAFCGLCLAKLGKGGQLSCPNCRREIQVTGTFPVEMTRSALLDCMEVIQTAQEARCEICDDSNQATSHCLDCAQALCEDCLAAHRKVKTTRDHAIVSLEEAAGSLFLLLQKVEKCLKHQDKKLKFYCKTCRSAICSTCVLILHKDRDVHDNVELSEIVEQARRQIESHCGGLDNILETILLPRAKMAAYSLQVTDASFKAAEQGIKDVFSKTVNTLLERKTQAMEELRSKYKSDRMRMEDQAADTQFRVSSAKTSIALGRAVSFVGLPSHILAQEQELERVVQEARAEGEKPLQSLPCYKVTEDLSLVLKSLQELDAVKSVDAVTSWNTGVPTKLPRTSSPNRRRLDDQNMEPTSRTHDWDEETCPSQFPRRRSQSGLVGLENQGATCYLNSLIQMLRMTPEFWEAIFRLPPEELKCPSQNRHDQKCCRVLIEMQKLLANLQLADRQSVSTEALTLSLGWNNNKHLVQQDAQEFLHELFQIFQKSLQSCPITDLYGGQQVWKVTCSICQTESTKKEPFMDVSVALEGASRLEESLQQQYCGQETLSHRNQYHCSPCKRLVDATRTTKFQSLPPILIFTLARFNFDIQMGEHRKDNKPFGYPMELNMAPYMEKCQEDGKLVYDLFCVLLHRGPTADAGHYHAYICDVQNQGHCEVPPPVQAWFDFDDAQVTPVASQAVTWQSQGQECAYMLAYRRRSQHTPRLEPPYFGVPKQLAAEVLAENARLAEERVAYDRSINQVTLELHPDCNYVCKGGVLSARKSNYYLRLSLDRHQTLADLYSLVAKRYAGLIPEQFTLHRMERVGSIVHLYDELKDLPSQLWTLGLKNQAMIFVWDGQSVDGVRPHCGADSEPIHLTILSEKNTARSLRVPKNMTFAAFKATVSRQTAICVKYLELRKMVGSDRTSLLQAGNEQRLSQIPVEDGDRVLAKNYMLQEWEGLQCRLLVENHFPIGGGKYAWPPIHLAISFSATVAQLKQKIMKFFSMEQSEVQGRIRVRCPSGELQPPVNESLTITNALISQNSTVVLEPIPSLSTSQDSVRVKVMLCPTRLMPQFPQSLQLLSYLQSALQDRVAAQGQEALYCHSRLPVGQVAVAMTDTLQQLKERILALPVLASLAPPVPIHLRLRKLHQWKLGSIFQDTSQIVSMCKLAKCGQIGVQLVTEEDSARTDGVLLELVQRVPGTRLYEEPVEIIYQCPNGIFPRELRQHIADVFSIPEEFLLAAKHFPTRCEWRIIDGALEKTSSNGMSVPMNLRQEPFYMQDGDTIGIKDLRLEPWDMLEDFFTEAEKQALENLHGMLEACLSL